MCVTLTPVTLLIKTRVTKINSPPDELAEIISADIQYRQITELAKTVWGYSFFPLCLPGFFYIGIKLYQGMLTGFWSNHIPCQNCQEKL